MGSEGRGFTTVALVTFIVSGIAVYEYYKTPSKISDTPVVTSPRPRQDQMPSREPVKPEKGSSLPKALTPQITIGPWTINKDPEPQPSTQISSEFIGRWTGKVIQTGEVKDEYSVTVMINPSKANDRIGTVNYATLNCGGDLFLVSATYIRISVEEKLMWGQTNCVDRSVINLTKNKDGTLEYSVRVADLSASAVLKKLTP